MKRYIFKMYEYKLEFKFTVKGVIDMLGVMYMCLTVNHLRKEKKNLVTMFIA